MSQSHRRPVRFLITAAALVALLAGAAQGQPSLQSIEPSSGPTAGGTLLRLVGTNLNAGAAAFVGGNPAEVVAALGTSMFIRCPAGHGAPRPVQVVDAGGQFSNLLPFSYLGPVIESVNPTSGSTSGGTLITVTGRDFGLSPSVVIGGTPATNLPGQVTHNQIVCELPPGAGADRNLVVTAAGQSSSPRLFDYSPPEISNVAPASAPTSGGTLLTINGSNFGVSPLVFINGQLAPISSLLPHTRIVCTVPEGDGKTAEVVVVAGNQEGSPASFGYEAPSILGIITPPGGVSTSGGVRLTIQGANFGIAPSVTVGGAPGVIVQSSHSSIEFDAPEGTGSQAEVVVDAQDQSTSTAISYAPPVIASISGGPTGNTVPSSGGTIITIFGQNFGASGHRLFVGGLPAPNVMPDPASPHSILTCITPPGTGRNHTVSVVAGDQVGSFGPLHYDMPSCPGDANGNGFVDFDDITAAIANWGGFCP